MKIDAAIQFAEALKSAAEQALAEGRTELNTTDLDVFRGVDDDARAELEAAIKRAGV